MNFDANLVRLIRASAMTVAVIVVISVATEIIKSLALVILLAFILTPLVEWFENRGRPRAPSVVLNFRHIRSALSGHDDASPGQCM
jgi:predicted PurR-regulated permease PerM